ncbi:MAG: helix-turn-helix transcriptional regulator [Eubacteriales bacterium]|nr:helix-turn-helix transcriptional regulator [Eubacteriales bacterium]
MKLADNLQIQRKKMGFSQEELAEKCQISRQAIAKWESGESVPTIEKLIFLADLYDLTLDELVGRVVKDDYDRFAEYIKKYVPAEIKFGKDDDVTAVVGRYISFVDSLGLTGELKLKGLQDIFLTAAKDD